MRLIDADALEEKTKRYSLGYYEADEWAVPLEAIDEAPTIDAVEVVHGEWMPNHDGYWICSECGLRVLIYAKGNYCPNCGAKMDGEREGE